MAVRFAGAGTVLDAIEAAWRATGAAVVLATHDLLIAERLSIRWEVDDGELRTTVPACSP
jgi:ABC-type lipoprotein export system ATPase subunit